LRAGFQLKSRENGLYIGKSTKTRLAMTQNMTPSAQQRSAKWLDSAGLRPTRQRMTLAALLVGDGQNRHVTAESLFDAAKQQGDAVSLATVYNTLRAFCDVGLMQEVTVDGSKSYFDTNVHDHPHFYWEDEGRLTDAPADQLVIVRVPDAPAGAEIASVDVVIRLRKV
jgi:Fur family iron response transcriptional regulator